jgi:hypothetical protein
MDCTEGNLEFQFDQNWDVIKYDGHNFYQQRAKKLREMKAADFVAVNKNQCKLYIIEVKDFRIEHPESLTNLADTVAQKVRDTVAGLVGAHHSTGAGDWALPVKCLGSLRQEIYVVFLCELRNSTSPERLSSLTDRLKKNLGWLTKRVIAVDLNTFGKTAPGVTVKNLSGAGRL